MTPPVLAECREKAPEATNRLVVRVAAAVVLAVWISLAALALWLVARAF